jgi:hypothetical protein
MSSRLCDTWESRNDRSRRNSKIQRVFARPHRIPRPTRHLNPNPPNSREINVDVHGPFCAFLNAPLVGRRQPNDPHQRNSRQRSPQ